MAQVPPGSRTLQSCGAGSAGPALTLPLARAPFLASLLTSGPPLHAVSTQTPACPSCTCRPAGSLAQCRAEDLPTPQGSPVCEHRIRPGHPACVCIRAHVQLLPGALPVHSSPLPTRHVHTCASCLPVKLQVKCHLTQEVFSAPKIWDKYSSFKLLLFCDPT